MPRISGKAKGPSTLNGFKTWSARRPRGSARQAFAAVSVAAVSMLLNRPAQADVYWDPGYTGTKNGSGTGTWIQSATNWYNGTTDIAYDGSNAFFNGPAGAYTVTVNGSIGSPITVNGNITFGNASTGLPSAGTGAIYSLVAPLISATNLNASSQYINLASSAPIITVQGTSFNASSYTPVGNVASGYALIGNSAASTNNASQLSGGVILTGSNGFTLTGGGELILANPIAVTGTINVSGGSTLTVGNRLLPSSGYTQTPYAFLNNDNVNLIGSQLQFATTASLTNTTPPIMQVGNITITGSSAIDTYRIASSASSSITMANTTLYLNAGANLNFYQTGNTQGAAATVSVGSTIAEPDANGAANDIVTINSTENATGLKNENVKLGTYLDNGITTYFLGGGTANITGGTITISTAGASGSTGNWIVGSSAGGEELAISTTSGSVGGITTGNVTVNPYSALYLSGQGFLTWGSSSQTITLNGVGNTDYNTTSGSVSSAGNVFYPGALQLGSTTLSSTGTANYLESNIVLESTTTSNYITANSNTTSQIDGGISQNTSAGTYSLTKYGAGTLILNGTNTWTGGTNISQGTINVSSNSSLGTYDPTIKGPLTLASVNSASNTSLILNNASQTVGSLSSKFNSSTGTTTQTIVLNGTALNVVQTTAGTFGPGAVSTLSSVISGTGSLSLDSRSTAILTLSGLNNYSGGTTVSGGGLIVSNTTGSATGTGAVTVNNAIFGGSGIITGPVTASNTNFSIGTVTGGSGHITGTLNLSGGLSITGGTLNFSLNTPLGSDGIYLGNSQLTLSGTTTLNLFNLGALDAGSYTLINYNDPSGAPSIAGITYGQVAGGFNYSLSATTTALTLNVTQHNPLVWGLSGNGNWDNTSSNWLNNGTGSLTLFTNGSSALFDDTSGGTSSMISMVGQVTPSLVTFANNSKSYTLAGTGQLNGSTSVIVTGTGSVTIASTNASGNTFVGTIAVDGGGTLIVSGDNQLGNTANAISLTSFASFAQPSTLEFLNSNTSNRAITLYGTGGAIDVPGSTVTTLSGTIGGTGGLLKTDTGTLFLTNSTNSYTGTTNIGNGTLTLGAVGAISGSSPLIVASGATFRPGVFNNSVGSISGAGTIAFNTSGAAVLTVNTPNKTNTVFSGPITGSGAISMAGPGYLTMNNSGNTFSGGLLVSNNGTVIGGTSAASLGTGNFNISGSGEIQIHAPINSSQTIYVGTGGGQFNTGGNNVTVATLIGTGSLTDYGGHANTSFNTISTANTSGGLVIGKTGDGGGNDLLITAADSGGNTGLGVDIAAYPGGATNFITINPQYSATLGSSTDPSNALIVGNGSTGVQVGFNTTSANLSPFLGHSIGNPALSQFSITSNVSYSSTSTPGVLFRTYSIFEGKGFSAWDSGNVVVDDGATVTFTAPTASDYLIDDVATRNNGNLSGAVNSVVNVTGSGVVALTSGAVSNSASTQYYGSWNVAMGTGGNAGTGIAYVPGSTGTLLAAPITGAYGEVLNTFGYALGASAGASAPINLYSGLLALGADKADPDASTVLNVKSFRDPIAIYGGAIGSSGYEYAAAPVGLTYALVGNASSGASLITANIAGDIILEPGATGTILTFDPQNPTTGARSLNFITDGTGVNGNFTWGAGSQLVLNSNGTSGGMVSFGRTTGTITVGTGATFNVGQGTIANIGFVPGITGVTAVSGIDPLSSLLYPYAAVNVNVNGAINWGGRTNMSGDSLAGNGYENVKSYAVGSLTISNNSTATLLPAASNLSSSYRTILDATGLTIGTTGKLDLSNNDMVVQGGNLAQLTSLVKQGFNGGAWNNTGGIVSSSAASDTTHLHAIGIILNDNGTNTGTPLTSNFDGANENNPDSDVLLKYTYYGDTDLNGVVDGTDYSRIDYSYLNNQNSSNNALTGWFNGDFNYDGVINGSDYTLIDNAYNSQGASLAAELASPTAVPTGQLGGSGTASSVPEPTMLGLLAIGGFGLLGRRRTVRQPK